MRVIKYIILLVLFFELLSCNNKYFLKREADKVDNSVFEEQYYWNYTEGYRNALSGNYKTALTQYRTCMAILPERAAPYFQVSNIFSQAKDYENAIRFAQKAESLDSENIWYKLNLANLYQNQSKFDSAAAVYSRIVLLKNEPQFVYNLSMLYSQAGNSEKALEVLSGMDEEYVNSQEVLMTKYTIYNNLHKTDSAISVLETIIKLFPDDITNYLVFAEYLTEVGKNSKANTIYHEVLQKDSLSGITMVSYGDFYIRTLNVDSAFYFYNKALCCSDFDTDFKVKVVINLLNNKVIVENYFIKVEELLTTVSQSTTDFRVEAAFSDLYLNVQDYNNASIHLNKALVLKKDNYILWEQALLVNNILGNNRKVIQDATECKTYFPKQANPYLFSAIAFKLLNINDSARYCIDTCLSLSLRKEQKLQALNLSADLYREAGNYSRSDSCYEEILAFDSENLMVRNNYSYYLSVQGKNLDKALELSQLTIDKEPKNATYLDTYGWILYKMGKTKDAKIYIEEAIRNGAFTNAEVLDHYGEVMLALDRCKEAIEAWQNAISVDSTYIVQPKLDNLIKVCP